MIPYICQTKHDPANGSYGDCVRACIASILEIEPDQVPHFFNDEDTQAGHARIKEYLDGRGLALFTFAFDGGLSLDAVLESMWQNGGHYILLGGTAYESDHAVVCKNSAVVHNPAWTGVPIIKPLSINQWQIWVIAVK